MTGLAARITLDFTPFVHTRITGLVVIGFALLNDGSVVGILGFVLRQACTVRVVCLSSRGKAIGIVSLGTFGNLVLLAADAL